MISRLLIANRGEIAVRIARTAHRLGIDTVGVYSEPDADALHVDVVDVAVALGGSTPSESYLHGAAVIAAALETGCDAVHPGYGFLAENAAFAQSVVDAGLVWVGPTPEQITLLGDKVAAKKAAVEAGVPTTEVVEITEGRVPDDVSRPALVKAAAGGGGRGMRIVAEGDDLAAAIEAASREAAAAFGDGTVFVEPYIERGRHIEVQVFGDTQGNVVHLGERECSIQRRNQKVVEEAPSAGIDADTRAALCDGAVALARHVGYHGAGTVEFLVGDDGTITFLEVNTRLQVEHPVTEAVTGLDLVELQLRIADGESLPLRQDQISIDGHAIEVRVVAEDPSQDWLPSVGTVSDFSFGEGVRVDTGFRAGAVVSSDYDSLMAKVISHAPTRTDAARRLARALRTGSVAGVRTDVDTLVAILGESDFLAAATPTAYLADHPEVLAAAGPIGDDRLALLLGAAFSTEHAARAADPVSGFAPSCWRNLRTRGLRQVWLLDGVEHHLEVEMGGPSSAVVLVGPWPEPGEDGVLPDDQRRRAAVRLLARAPGRQVVEIDGTRRVIDVSLDGDVVVTRSRAGTLQWVRAARFEDHAADLSSGGPICPLPGSVIAVHVEAGQSVADGDLLMVIEAMKMEHQITATADAVVTEVRFVVGDRVDSGDLLVVLGDEDDSAANGEDTP